MEEIVWDNMMHIRPAVAETMVLPAICKRYLWNVSDFRWELTSQNKILKLHPNRNFLLECCPSCKDCSGTLFLSVSHSGPKTSVNVCCSFCKFCENYEKTLQKLFNCDESGDEEHRHVTKRARLNIKVGCRREFAYAMELKELLDGNVVYVPWDKNFYYFREDSTATHRRGWAVDKEGLCVRDAIARLLMPVSGEKHVLESRHVRDGICAEMKALLRDNDDVFIKGLNSNQKLVGFNNGIYDLSQGVFRQAEKTDLVTWSTHCTFIDEEEWETNRDDIIVILAEIFSFLLSIFGDDREVMTFMVDFLSTAFDGTKREHQLFVFWKGGVLFLLTI